jgi:hypothetical protein
MKNQEISYASDQLRSTNALVTGLVYSVTCTNQSSENTYFYFYQRTANQTSVIASLVWCASPYKVPPDGSFTFSWQETYSYFWQGYGAVQPGVVFNAQGLKAGTPETEVQFAIEDDTPVFGDVTMADLDGMKVSSKFNVPENMFGIGIGMSEVTTFLAQAIAGKEQEFEVEPMYRIASSAYMETGTVLSESSQDPEASLLFPDNTYSLQLTYKDGKFYKNGIELPG